MDQMIYNVKLPVQETSKTTKLLQIGENQTETESNNNIYQIEEDLTPRYQQFYDFSCLEYIYYDKNGNYKYKKQTHSSCTPICW